MMQYESHDRRRNGVDFGVDGFLIASAKQGDIVYFPGHTWYAGRMTGSRYAESVIMFLRNQQDHEPRFSDSYAKISYGGRFGKKKLISLTEKINKFFDFDMTSAIIENFGNTVRIK